MDGRYDDAESIDEMQNSEEIGWKYEMEKALVVKKRTNACQRFISFASARSHAMWSVEVIVGDSRIQEPLQQASCASPH